jgi:NADH-quinone oxidoreductase subunit C
MSSVRKSRARDYPGARSKCGNPANPLHRAGRSYNRGMIASEIAKRIASRFAVDAVYADDKHPRVHISVDRWTPLAKFLRFDPVLKFDWLACLTGLDYPASDQVAVTYDLSSFDHRHRFAVRVTTARAIGVFPSTVDLWPAADWHEREAFDLFGFDFTGHPGLRRILLAEDWEGHPLRKDYVFPREYHGIPASVELDWHQT